MTTGEMVVVYLYGYLFPLTVLIFLLVYIDERHKDFLSNENYMVLSNLTKAITNFPLYSIGGVTSILVGSDLGYGSFDPFDLDTIREKDALTYKNALMFVNVLPAVILIQALLRNHKFRVDNSFLYNKGEL